MRRATKVSTALPLIRKKLKSFGDLAIRGTNQLHEKTQTLEDNRNGRYISFHNSVIFDSKILNSRESTRKLISRIGNSVIVAMNFAFVYSKFEYSLDKNRNPIFKYNEKDKPVVVVSFNSDVTDKQKIVLSNSFKVKKINLRENVNGDKSRSVHADSKDVHYITIDKEDLVDLKIAWQNELSKQKGLILGTNILFSEFLNNFLAKRVISKALKEHNNSIKSLK